MYTCVCARGCWEVMTVEEQQAGSPGGAPWADGEEDPSQPCSVWAEI